MDAACVQWSVPLNTLRYEHVFKTGYGSVSERVRWHLATGQKLDPKKKKNDNPEDAFIGVEQSNVAVQFAFWGACTWWKTCKTCHIITLFFFWVKVSYIVPNKLIQFHLWWSIGQLKLEQFGGSLTALLYGLCQTNPSPISDIAFHMHTRY